MSIILFAGDFHGDFESVYSKLKTQYSNIDYDIIVQCGDFGWWKEILESPSAQKNLKKICKKPVYFVRGNHEQYSFNNKPFFSDYTNTICKAYLKDIKTPPCHLDNLHAVNIDGRILAGIGGAESIDKNVRIPGVSYWDEERVNEKWVQHTFSYSLDIIVSHDCPENFANTFIHRPTNNIKLGNRTLSKVYNKYQPLFWFFGHHHKKYVIPDPRTGTTFIGLPIFQEGGGVLLNTDTMRLKDV